MNVWSHFIRERSATDIKTFTFLGTLRSCIMEGKLIDFRDNHTGVIMSDNKTKLNNNFLKGSACAVEGGSSKNQSVSVPRTHLAPADAFK